MSKVIYQIVGLEVGETFETEELAAVELRYPLTGETELGGRLRPELQGQPKFEGLCGPMWGGEIEGGYKVRYETWPAYEVYSR